MAESTHGSGRHVFGDLTNILRKRSAPSDLEKSMGGIKVRRIEKDTDTWKEFDEYAKNSSKGKGIVYGHLFDGVAKENFERPSIFRNSKVQHMAAEAAGLLSKEDTDLRNQNNCASLDSFDLSTKEQDSSLESEADYDDEYYDDMDGKLPSHFSSSELAHTAAANDGGDMPSSSVHHASMRTSGSQDAVATESCACSFCCKAALLFMDLHCQDARSRLSGLKKSIKFARSLEEKSKGNEYSANVAGYNSKRAVEMEFELSQQRRSLFLYTENALVRESTQLHSTFMKLKELRENCKNDVEWISNSSLGK
ncbi:unnamed protein product [Urochloa humidicola]